MSGLRLRPCRADDLAPLLACQHGLGVRPAWSLAYLTEQLTDVARAHGQHVAVAERAGRVVGAVGWVDAGAMWFGAPMIAPEAEVADALIAEVVGRARAAGAAAVRIGNNTPVLAEVLAGRGFAWALAFSTVGRATARRSCAPPSALPSALTQVALPEAAPAALVDLHNAAFAGLDNTRPIDRDELDAMIATSWPAGSAAWLDDRGRAAAMIIAIRDRDHGDDHDHAVIDLIAVAESARRRGLARAIVDRTLEVAARAGVPEVRALIASTNTASLALHAAAGFTELWRRDIWQLTF
jgi:ribosomal protein S18 acetylase RimI-like enzyme